MKHIPFFDSFDPLQKRLTLRNASRIPDEVFELSEQIEILDLSGGSLSRLPSRFPELRNLRILFLWRNPLSVVPELLGECGNLELLGCKSCGLTTIPEQSLPPSLRWLILTDNRLETLPKSIRKLSKLRKLSLAANKFRKLPEELVECSALELVRLGANELTVPPEGLFELPTLAWYGDAGNCFSAIGETSATPLVIPPDGIIYGPQIGGSPSSQVFRGVLKSSSREVAVKHYQGRLTSDGYAKDDIQAFLAAGRHPNIIEALGRVDVPEDSDERLVLSLLPKEYSTLGLPPSFKTITRDRFETGTQFTISFIENVLRDIANALEHLHRRGIAHGDLYAHNILSDPSGRSILGDFGAASFYERDAGRLREQVETRAFGYLIDDLLGQLESSGASTVPQSILEIRSWCGNPITKELPTFHDIQLMLNRKSTH